ncbi:MAG: ABC transporter ATP-binding protein [Actinobacteria bacterium]|nr:ABC transporter ATP-binding protein [Actinomycetota bacterium]
MDAAVAAEGLTKSYGPHRGVADLDLEVGPGEVFGYLGPNGSGKTTTIRLLLDLLRPTSGSVRVLGRDPRRDGPALRREIGYLPGDLAFYDRMTGAEVLAYLGHLRGIDGPAAAAPIAGRLDLDLSRPVRDLSTGNRQKLGIAQALMHRPRLLILDEPTAGLDPLVQRAFYDMVRAARDEGATVFLSSHVLGEVERIADRVGIIREGRMVVVESLEGLRAKALRTFEVRFAAPVEAAGFAGIPGVDDVTVDGTVLHCTVAGPAGPLMRAAARHEIVNVVSRDADLEDLFLRTYEGAGDAA